MPQKSLKDAIRKHRGTPSPFQPDVSSLLNDLVEKTVGAHLKEHLEPLITKAVGVHVQAQVERLMKQGLKGETGKQGPAGVSPSIDTDRIAHVAAQLSAARDDTVLEQKILKSIPQPDMRALAKAAAALVPPSRNGVDGRSSRDGKDGSPDTPDQIVEKIHRSNKKIKIEHIEGLDKTLRGVNMSLREKNKLAREFGGGGDLVAAGSGVTITEINHQKVISATGGSVTYLEPTETPDGNIKIFTFTAAAAQPSSVLSDGVRMKAVTKNGIVNWTWNNSLKQATMTIPPENDIEAIV